MRSQAFSLPHDQLIDVIRTSCWVSAAGPAAWDRKFTVYSPTILPTGLAKFTAVWDTGASRTFVSRRVVDACHLAKVGRAKTQSHRGVSNANLYRASVVLPNGTVFTDVLVTEAKVVHGDVLIGMDIITHCDLAISNVDGKTFFSFRAPSLKSVDFVEEQEIFEGIR